MTTSAKKYINVLVLTGGAILLGGSYLILVSDRPASDEVLSLPELDKIEQIEDRVEIVEGLWIGPDQEAGVDGQNLINMLNAKQDREQEVPEFEVGKNPFEVMTETAGVETEPDLTEEESPEDGL